MNRIIRFLAIAMAMASFAACVKEVPAPTPNPRPEVEVTKEVVLTDISFDARLGESLSSVWNGQVVIYDNDATHEGNIFEATKVNGTRATLTGKAYDPADMYYALYPATAFESFQGGKAVRNIPANQAVKANDAELAPDAQVTFAQALSTELKFTPVTAYASFTVGADDLVSFTLRAAGDEDIAGQTEVDVFQKEVVLVSGEKAITVTAEGMEMFENKNYAVEVLPGEYKNGFVATLTFEDGTTYENTFPNAIEIRSGDVVMVGVIADSAIPSFFVTPTGAGDKSGAKWENAMDIATFNASLKNTAGIDGALYHFAEGTYAGLCSTFAVGAELYGGYPAGLKGRQLTGRDPETHETIFSNTGGERVLGHFTKTTAVVDGITFSATTVNKQGAALSVSCVGANMTVKNCKFTGLQATQGAALYSANSAVVSMEGCTFTGNTATAYGGAITISSGVNLTVKDCSFNNNTAKDYGGGFCQDNASAVSSFENCTFTGNSCNRGGAISDYSGKCTVKACTFTSNTSTAQGAAIQLQNNTSDLTVSSSTFTSNTAKDSDGGAIQLYNGTAAVDDCTFDSNVAKFGGAFNINNGAAVVKINGCNFTGNMPGTEMRGASVVCLGNGTCMMNDCFISGNGLANEHDGNCIFRAFNGSRLMIANTFIQDNITKTTHAMQQGANTLFANVTMVGEAPAVGLWAPNTLNVWVNTALLNSKGGISVHGNANTSAFKVALKGGCILQGYDNFGAATVTKTATDVDDAVYADLNVTKNAEGKYVIGNYPAGWAKSSDAEVAEVLKTSFTIGTTNYGEQFYNWLHEINAL